MAEPAVTRDQEVLIQSRALGDPTRHAIFLTVRDAAEPVTVAHLTDTFGLNHNAVRQHLAKLCAAGLVAEEAGPRTGPGRPAKRYVATATAAERWGTPPAYESLALMLLDVIRTGAAPEEVGRTEGRRLAEELQGVNGTVEMLEVISRRLGFEPRRQPRADGTDIVLDRCPFVGPAAEDPAVVCALHRGVAAGIADVSADRARLIDLVIEPPQRAGCRFLIAGPDEADDEADADEADVEAIPPER